MADNTLISNGITIDGEVTGDEPVTVEGTVKGQINVQATVTVAQAGTVEADVNTTEFHISGKMTGNAQASERIEITTEGRVVGDLKSPRILIADGAGFKGHIDMDV